MPASYRPIKKTCSARRATSNVLLPTFVMLTMPPNSAMSAIHDRMPAVLKRGDVKTCINGSYSDEQRVAWLRQDPCPAQQLNISVYKDHKAGQ